MSGPTPPRGEERGRRPLHVLVADDDGLARRVIAEALREAAPSVMVTAARERREALELARYYRPTVLLIELALPPAGARELIVRALAAAPRLRIVTISRGAGDDQDVLAALRAGSVGHISKDLEPRELARLVLLAAGGEAVVPRRLTGALLGLVRSAHGSGWRPLQSSLTTREWQVIELLGEGASTQQIAEHLVLSLSTIYTHINSVLRKLGVHSRPEAIAAAARLREQEVMRKVLTESR